MCLYLQEGLLNTVAHSIVERVLITLKQLIRSCASPILSINITLGNK